MYTIPRPSTRKPYRFTLPPLKACLLLRTSLAAAAAARGQQLNRQRHETLKLALLHTAVLVLHKWVLLVLHKRVLVALHRPVLHKRVLHKVVLVVLHKAVVRESRVYVTPQKHAAHSLDPTAPHATPVTAAAMGAVGWAVVVA
jgi:hypothetical protein